jgi:hypothetical protein
MDKKKLDRKNLIHGNVFVNKVEKIGPCHLYGKKGNKNFWTSHSA